MKVRVTTVTIPNNLGLALDTDITLPGQGGPFPFVMIIHGFTGYKESADLVDISEKLAERGIASVRFTASGFGGSGGTIERDYRFTNHLRDVDTVYDAMRTHPEILSRRVGVYGHSMGGKMAILFARSHPEVSAVCIVSAPVSFFVTNLTEPTDEWKRKGFLEKTSGRDTKTIRIPYAYCDDAEQSSYDVIASAKYLSSVSALVIAGTADDTVPYSETRRIFDALATPEKQWALITGMEHKYRNDPDLMARVNTSVASFFETALQR